MLHVYVHPAYADMVCLPMTHFQWDALKECGAKVCYGDEFDAVQPGVEDVLVCFGRIDEHVDAFHRFAPENRWHWVVDESNSTTEPYDKAMAYMREKGFRNIVVTYPNEANLQKLSANGFRYVVHPQTVPSIRPKAQTEYNVLVSGQLNESFYPTRTRVARALGNLACELPTPGQDMATRVHGIVRDRYYDFLDKFRMGVVCRAGSRDRLVGKYVEFGMCHVLPIGDCPSYMPEGMSRAMVDVSGMSDEEVVREVRRLLNSPPELEERTSRYVAAVMDNFLSVPCARRLLENIQGPGKG